MPVILRLRVSLFFLVVGTAIAVPWAAIIALFKLI